MKSNNLFTYLLYALLGVLLLAAGYFALEKRKEAAQRAEELRRDAEQLERTLSGIESVDTSSAEGSAFVGESTPKTTTGKADKNGIEDDPTPASATKPATTTQSATAAKPTTATKTPAPTTQSPTTAATTSKGVTTTATKPKSTTPPANNGRFLVVVGAFGNVANARTEMERFVKMGYRDAEVVKYKSNMWRVVAKRCTKRSEAEQYEGDLERHGIDAMVVDANKK